MDKIHNFYHFTSWDPKQINCNAIYSTDTWEYSYYWKNKLAGIGMGVEDLQVPNELRPFLLQPIVKQLFESGKYGSELFKEYVFEEVRQADFPQCPSRKRCLFLFEKTCDPEMVARVLGWNSPQASLVEVAVSSDNGRLLKCDMNLLNCNSFKHAELVNVAKQYWQGTNDLKPQNEVLYEGQFQIVQILTTPKRK